MSLPSIEIIPTLVCFVLFIFIIPIIFYWLWNITMLRIFGLKKITYWEALRLFLISILIFGIWGII